MIVSLRSQDILYKDLKVLFLLQFEIFRGKDFYTLEFLKVYHVLILFSKFLEGIFGIQCWFIEE